MLDSDSGDSNYESSVRGGSLSDEDSLIISRPMFIPRNERTTIVTKENRAEINKEKQEQSITEKERRKVQAKILLAETLRRQDEMKESQNAIEGDSDAGIPIDDDGDGDDEYENWKIREVTRLKKALEEKDEYEREKLEILRRRGLTDIEREEEDKLKLEPTKEAKPRLKFLQRYYHKGSFYMDISSIKSSNDVRIQDYSAPTLGDIVDKERLPEIMQVKNFGKRGRTKYTHLLDQDTSVKDKNWINTRPDKSIMKAYAEKRSGANKI